MSNNRFSNSRREFIKKSGMLALGSGLPVGGASSLAQAYPLLYPPITRIFLVKEGGFNTGPSTVTADPIAGRPWSEGDWTNANCLNAAEGFNLFRYLTGSGDILVWDAQQWLFSTTQTLASAPIVPGLYRIWSRYLDPLSTSFRQQDPNARLFTLDKNLVDGTMELEFKGITLTRADTSTAMDGSLLRVDGSISGVYFDNVRIGGFRATGGGRILNDGNSATTIERRLGFFNTSFYALTLSDYNTGIVSTRTNTDLEIANTNIRDISVETGAPMTFHGLFHVNGGLRAKGVTIENLVITGGGDASFLRGVFVHSQLSTRLAAIENITARNAIISNGQVQSLIIMSYGKHTVSNLRLTNCHAKPSVVSQNLGLAALSIGYTIDQVVIPALGIYNNISAVNCSAQYGLLAYSSAGGRIIASNLSASNCTVEAGMVYSGGSGDTDVDNLTVTDCFSTSSAGLSVYAHNVHRMNKNPPEARKKVVTVRNVLSARNSFVGGSAVDAGYRSDVWLATYSAYHGMTLNLRNYMASNPGLTHDVVAYRTSADASVHLSVSGVSTNKALSESVYNVDDLATVEVSNYIQAAT